MSSRGVSFRRLRRCVIGDDAFDENADARPSGGSCGRLVVRGRAEKPRPVRGDSDRRNIGEAIRMANDRRFLDEN